MFLLSLSFGLLILGGVVSLLPALSPRSSAIVGAGTNVVGALLGLVAAIGVLSGRLTIEASPVWAVAFGHLAIALDPLSAFFLAVLCVISPFIAIFGISYMSEGEHANHSRSSWCWLNLLVVSIAAIFLARNGVVFLVAWELMAITSFFLVIHESHEESVRHAGWVYLVASHVGTAFLIVMFLLLGTPSGRLDFATFSTAAAPPAFLFVCALIGFGTKAGLVPLHVWLPEAHPAAPSHVSALLSGVMIKTGIYGLIRMLTFLGTPAPWWGWTLVTAGIVAALFGVVFAMAQRDMKRLLAYSSVENVGIIVMGLGTAVLGLAWGSVPLTIFGLAGCLLHTLNHALFKSLLFLGAGAVLHRTGTRDIERLGGVGRGMPMTAAAFLVGALAICGVPPLNGFVSEFFLYFASLQQIITARGAMTVPSALIVAALALVGGLAMATFTKIYGIVFLGEPRSDHGRNAVECGWLMRFAMIGLAILCLAASLFSPFLLRGLAPVFQSLLGSAPENYAAPLAAGVSLLQTFVLAAASFVMFFGALFAARRIFLTGKNVRSAVTWDCGYAAPTARMQYTASSFIDPLVVLMQSVLRTERRFSGVRGFFPKEGAMSTVTPDVFMDRAFAPALRAFQRASAALLRIQSGRVHTYIAYIVVTLVVLLVWKLW